MQLMKPVNFVFVLQAFSNDRVKTSPFLPKITPGGSFIRNNIECKNTSCTVVVGSQNSEVQPVSPHIPVKG